jgi:hypothetical protein
MFSRDFFSKKIIHKTSFLLVLVVFTLYPNRASAWGDAIPAAIIKDTMETIRHTIEGALLGTLKVAAIEVLNSQVMGFVGGAVGSDSKVITNFEDFIDTVAEEEAERIVVNDFLSQSLRGKGSSANYIKIDTNGGIRADYDAFLRDAILETVRDRKRISQNDYAECSTSGSDPRKGIEEGDLRAISCMVASEKNNPIGISLAAEAAYDAEYQRKAQEQIVKAQSSGYSPAIDKEGNIITPSGSIQNLVDNVTKLGYDTITGATNPGEFLSGVVVSVVNRSVSNLVQRGVGEVQGKIRREIRNVDRKIIGAKNNAERSLGPGAIYIDAALEQRVKTKKTTAPKIPQTTGP